jgi:hypothetical protein
LWVDLYSTWQPAGSRCPVDSQYHVICGGHSEQQQFLERESPFVIMSLTRAHERITARGHIVREKDNRPIAFPEALLFMRTGIYRLVGIIRHHGRTPDGGHYTAVCRTTAFDDNTECAYHDFNDNRSAVGMRWLDLESNPVRREVCVLLYARQEGGAACGHLGDTPYMRGRGSLELLGLPVVGVPLQAAGGAPAVAIVRAPFIGEPAPEHAAESSRKRLPPRRPLPRAMSVHEDTSPDVLSEAMAACALRDSRVAASAPSEAIRTLGRRLSEVSLAGECERDASTFAAAPLAACAPERPAGASLLKRDRRTAPLL